jgi:Fe-S cluster assembly ATPase SufC
MKEKMALMNIDQSLLSRSLNEGFSGGEKKRNEIFQMAMLQPKLAILDETDSDSTSMRSASLRMVSTNCAARIIPYWLLPTINVCWIISFPISSTCCTMDA